MNVFLVLILIPLYFVFAISQPELGVSDSSMCRGSDTSIFFTRCPIASERG